MITWLVHTVASLSYEIYEYYADRFYLLHFDVDKVTRGVSKVGYKATMQKDIKTISLLRI